MSERRLKRNKFILHKKKLESHLRAIEKANGSALALLNEMLRDSDFNDIQEDVIYTLYNDFCRSEHLLVGLLEVMGQICRPKSKAI